ncbi:MAG: outer membrane protein assembly factor BamD [Sneathiellaceae bacterium]
MLTESRIALPSIRPLILLFLALFIAGCSGDDQPLYVERPVEELYNGALNNLEQGNWEDAATGFDEVERQHPYSVWATKAQLMAAYSYYQSNRYDDAILAAERFISLHPGNKDIAYAYYLVAISYYEQIVDVGRDQGNTLRALQALQEVVRRFPNTEYARDAGLKIDLARDHLAGKDMEIGRFYQKQALYLAAILRYRSVVENYQTTSHVPEALMRLVECYLALGVASEAQTAAAVLGYNYPGSSWYLDAYNMLTGENLYPQIDDRSWIAQTWDSLF